MGNPCSTTQRIQINSSPIQNKNEYKISEFQRKESIFQIGIIDGTPQTIHKQLYHCKKSQLEQKPHLIQQEQGLLTAVLCLPMLEKQYLTNTLEEVTCNTNRSCSVKFQTHREFL